MQPDLSAQLAFTVGQRDTYLLKYDKAAYVRRNESSLKRKRRSSAGLSQVSLYYTSVLVGGPIRNRRRTIHSLSRSVARLSVHSSCGYLRKELAVPRTAGRNSDFPAAEINTACDYAFGRAVPSKASRPIRTHAQGTDV